MPFGSDLDGPEQREPPRGAGCECRPAWFFPIVDEFMRDGRHQPGGSARRAANRRELLDRAAKSELVNDPWRGLQDHQGRRRCSLFRPDGRPDANSASADEAGWRKREGREEPPRQDRSRRQRRRLDRAPAQGAGPDRLFGRSGSGAQGRRRFRQDARAVRHSWRSDGKTSLDPNGVKALAALPSLDELRAKIVGLIQAPATKIAQVVNAPAAKVARVVQAYAAKSGESAAA